MEAFNVLTKEEQKYRKEVLKYEEKYKFIDISKMHEKVTFL